MIAAALAAVAEVLLGVRWRSFTQKRGRAAAGAVVEDVVVVVLAMVACWPRPRGLARGKRHRRRS
jgi:hypothetical protein